MASTGDGEKEVSCRVTNSVLRYAESLGYETDSIVEGLPYSRQYLVDPFNWVPYDVRETVCRRAAELLNDERFMYRVGLATPKLNPLGGVEHLVRLLASPKTAYRTVPKYAALFDRVFEFSSTLSGDNRATVTMSLREDYPVSRDSCWYAQGILAAIPTMWGLPPAQVCEKQCICEPPEEDRREGVTYGAGSCVYEVAWQRARRWYRRLLDRLPGTKARASNTVRELERNFELLDQKNAELARSNTRLAKVREIALALDTATTPEEVLSSAVELARDIPGVCFVIALKRAESGDYVEATCYSRLRVQVVNEGLKAIGFDPDVELGEDPGGGKLRFAAADLALAADYFSNPRMLVRDRLSDLLEGAWPKELCDAMQVVASIRRCVVVPLLAEHKSQGSLVFLLDQDVPLEILEMVAAHCAASLRNIAAIKALERRNAELRALNAIAGQTSSSPQLDSIARSTIREAVRVFDASAGAVYLWNESGHALELMAHEGMPESMASLSARIELGGRGVGEFFRSEARILAGDMREYAHEFPEHLALLSEAGPLPFTCAVLGSGGRRSGIMTVVRRGRTAFSDEEKGLLQAIANQLSVAMENARLHADALARLKEAQLAKKEQEQALCSLAESEEMLRLTVESITEGITSTDLEGRIVRGNETAAQMHGFHAEELIGRSAFELIAAKDRSRAMEVLQRTLSEGRSGTVQYAFVKKDGSEFPAELSAALLRNRSGEPMGFVAATRDITARKEAEDALRRSEEHYRFLFDNVLDGVFAIDGETLRVAFGNPAAVRIFGFERVEDAVGMDPLEFVPPEERERALNIIVEDAFRNDLRRTEEFRTTTRDGREIWIEAVGAITDYGGKPVSLVSIRDVTQRKKAEATLRTQKELIDRILGSTPNAVLVIGPGMRVLLANAAFYETFKLERDTVEGECLTDFIPAADWSALSSGALAGDESRASLEFRQRIEGRDRIVVARMIPMGGGELLLILSDVTDDRERQERLYLTDRLASVGEMVSGVAHELNNPLTSVIGLSQLLIGEEMPAEVNEDIRAIYGEAQRAGAIVKNLLTFARKHAPVRQGTQLTKVVDDVLRLRGYEHRVNNIRVEPCFAPQLPEVLADYFQMQQVFLNIVLNAEAAMRKAHGHGTLTVTAEQSDGRIRVSFADDGPGIAPENLGRLFDPFFTTKEVGEGTGLGLSICYGIVKAHGGNISARSEPGKGATFVVELPVNGN